SCRRVVHSPCMLQKMTFCLSGLLLCGLVALIPTPTLGQSTILGIDRAAGPVRLWLNGETGRDYMLESSDDGMKPESWQFLLTTPLLNGPQPWFDAQSLLVPQRFYRAVKLDPTGPVSAPNFRLMDHQGRSRELDYYLTNPNVKAMVLVFTANGCAEMPHM